MPRKSRIELPGLLYHLIMRGIERRPIFVDRQDYFNFHNRLAQCVQESSGTRCYAWVLMPNHVHLLVQSGTKPVSRLMRKLLTGYAVSFNRRYKRAGHLFQNRYKAIICAEESYLLELVRYIHLNPLRAGLVKNLNELANYEWSGHPVLLGLRRGEWQETEEILIRFGKGIKEAKQKYSEFIAAGVEQGHRTEFSGGGLIRSQGGIVNVLANRRSGFKEEYDDRILGGGDFVGRVIRQTEKEVEEKHKIGSKLSWTKLVSRIEKKCAVTLPQIQGQRKNRQISRSRALLSYLGMKYLGWSGSRIGREIGISRSGVIRMYQRGEKIATAEPDFIGELLGE